MYCEFLEQKLVSERKTSATTRALERTTNEQAAKDRFVHLQKLVELYK